MTDAMGELKRLYQMLGTVSTQQYAEQIQKVCTAFYEDGRNGRVIPDFKTEKEFEDFMAAVWQKYKTKLYCDGLNAGAAIQQNGIEAAFLGAPEKMHIYDILGILRKQREKVHD